MSPPLFCQHISIDWYHGMCVSQLNMFSVPCSTTYVNVWCRSNWIWVLVRFPMSQRNWYNSLYFHTWFVWDWLLLLFRSASFLNEKQRVRCAALISQCVQRIKPDTVTGCSLHAVSLHLICLFKYTIFPYNKMLACK